MDAFIPSMPLEQQGLVRRYRVERLDGSHPPGTEYLVLRLGSDDHATQAAVFAYARAVRHSHPLLAKDLLATLSLSADQARVALED